MSDEEKQAIKYIKNILNYEKLYYHDGIETNFLRPVDKENVNIVLNLIKKQSKEIEELKDIRSIFNMGRRSYKNEIENKIKAKIEEVKDGTYDAKIVLQSLLEKRSKINE